MIYLSWLVLGFLAIRLFIALLNVINRQWLHDGVVTSTPLVSILIPARNEENNIGTLLESLLQQDYKNLEIIVYDDLSTDNTAAIVNNYCFSDNRVRIVNGIELPRGWLGKNYACHTLSQEAKGDYLLFIDADVVTFPKLITQAMAHLKKHQLSLLSIFPQQIMHSLGELITVPLMTWILVSLLPLRLTRDSKKPSLSSANGQFMLFDASVYKQIQFHKLVKNVAVEDIVIFKELKRNRFKGHTILSNGQVKCRMYKGFGEAARGFSKNIFYFFGKSPIASFAFAIITTFGFVPLLFWLGGPFPFIWLAGEASIRLIIAIATRQNGFKLVLLAPLQQLAFFWILFIAYRVKILGNLEWKGRIVN